MQEEAARAGDFHQGFISGQGDETRADVHPRFALYVVLGVTPDEVLPWGGERQVTRASGRPLRVTTGVGEQLVRRRLFDSTC